MRHLKWMMTIVCIAQVIFNGFLAYKTQSALYGFCAGLWIVPAVLYAKMAMEER